jgi:hypothetical protein
MRLQGVEVTASNATALLERLEVEFHDEWIT